jgi:hypothetical protein
VQIPQNLDFDVQNSSHGSNSNDQQETELQPVEEELPLFTAVISSAVTTIPEVLSETKDALALAYTFSEGELANQ